MKGYSSFLIIAVTFSSVACSSVRYNRVYSVADEFRENVKTYTRISLRSEEKRTEIGSARIVLEKVVSNEGEAVRAYFVVTRSSFSFKVDDKGFIKADDKKFEISLLDPVSQLKTKSEATISGLATVDTSGVVTGQSADIETRTWIEDKFVINLAKEVETGILKAQNVLFRFYFGPIPATYELKEKKLVLVKQILAQ